MYAVRSGENVKEAAGLVARNVHALVHQFAPSDQLSGDKEQSHHRSNEPQLAKAGNISLREPQPCPLEREAASEEHGGIGPENPRQPHGDPHSAAVMKQKKRA